LFSPFFNFFCRGEHFFAQVMMGDRPELQAGEAVQIGDQVVLPLVAFLETGLSFFKHHDGIVPRRQ
jgi:hypothetical protein